MTYQEAMSLQPGGLVVCYDTISKFNKAEIIDTYCLLSNKQTAYIPKKIYKINSIVKSLAYKDAVQIIIGRAGDARLTLYSFQCEKIVFDIPKEGSVLIDDLGNWKYLESILLKNNRMRRDTIDLGDRYLVWYDDSIYCDYGYPDPEVKYYNIEDLYILIKVVNFNEQTKTKEENGKQNNYTGASCKVNPTVSKVTGGSECRGNSIRGRISSVKIIIGHLSYTAISCSGEEGS